MNKVEKKEEWTLTQELLEIIHDSNRPEEERISARDQLANNSRKLISEILNGIDIEGLSLDRDDLLIDGYLGLIKAINNFDSKKEESYSAYANPFNVYAKQYIERKILPSIKSPDSFAEEIISQIESTDENITRNIRKRIAFCVQAEKCFADLLKIGFCNVEDTERESFNQVETKMILVIIEKIIFNDKNLSEEQKTVLREYLGYNDYHDPSDVPKIARKLGISKNEVRNLKESGLKKIRRSYKSNANFISLLIVSSHGNEGF